MSPNDPEPYYWCHVFCCTNQRAEGHERGSCKQRGSEPLREHMKRSAKKLGLGRVRINASGCLDRCELGPVMVIYPDGVWYTYRSREDVDEILRKHVVEGKRVERLMLLPTDEAPEDREARATELSGSV